MSVYRVDALTGSGGFKVQVVDGAGGLRVVGVFLTEADANLWIAADSSGPEADVDVDGRLPLLHGRPGNS